jgi:hypothetical protein
MNKGFNKKIERGPVLHELSALIWALKQIPIKIESRTQASYPFETSLPSTDQSNQRLEL